MAEAQAARASLRHRRFQNCIAAQSALDDASTTPLHRICLRALDSVAPWPTVGTFIVFLRRPATGPPMALVGADLVSLPLLERHRGVRGSRASAVIAAEHFTSLAVPAD